mgnify:CR=1 FL=1
MDMKTKDVFLSISYLDLDINKIYEMMYDAGVSEKDMRIGSLLNFCASKNIAQVKIIEPKIYNKISKRFYGIETASSIRGYFNIDKPKELSWREYALHLLATSPDPARSNWREKVISTILAVKYSSISCPDLTIRAFNILTKIGKEIQEKVNNEYWETDDMLMHGKIERSGKNVISLSRLPNESFEKELTNVIEYVINNKIKGTLSVLSREIPEIDFSAKDKEAIKKIRLVFKENIHSTRNWKEICVAILKNDYTMKYLGFSKTFSEKINIRNLRY